MKHKHTCTRSRAQPVFPAGASLPFTAELTTKTRRASADLPPKRRSDNRRKQLLFILQWPGSKENRRFFKEESALFSLLNVPPNATRCTMRQGTALPLTCCSSKGEGHYSFQSCRQRLAWRTNGGLFYVWPHPCRPASPHSTRGGQRRRMCLASPFGGAFYCGGSVSFSVHLRRAKVLPDCGHSGAFMLVLIPRKCVSFLGS